MTDMREETSDAINRLKMELHTTPLGRLCRMPSDDARAILDHITALTAEVFEWRECAQYDATMEGPVFKGWNRLQMDRCRKRFNEAGAHKETTDAG